MCLILLAWQAHPRWRLILGANRDELHARATQAADWWPDLPGVFAGRDLVAGGTWLGVSAGGRFAALTNHRDLRRPTRAAESRGSLVRDFLAGSEAPLDYLARIERQRERWLPFNLLVGEGQQLACLSSEAIAGNRVTVLSAGVHGLSNAILDTPWPKVSAGCRALSDLLAQPIDAQAAVQDALFGVLADRRTAPDRDLPETGLPRDRERILSATKIVDPVYGTRCSSVLLIDHDGRWHLAERSFAADGTVLGSAAALFPQDDGVAVNRWQG